MAKVISNELDLPGKLRGQPALGVLLELGYRIHKSARNIEWRHADIDIEHDSSKGGASGGVESFEGVKHLTENVILAILFPREKITILASSNCQSGGTLLDDKVEGRNEGLEIPFPLRQVGITISMNRVGKVAQNVR